MYKLADQCGMHDLIPFIAEEKHKQIKKEVEGRDVSVIFDSTKRLGEAVIIRFIDDGWEIVQRLVRVQLLVKSITGKERARELVNVISVEYGTSVNQLLAAMHDRASANTVAMTTMKVQYCPGTRYNAKACVWRSHAVANTFSQEANEIAHGRERICTRRQTRSHMVTNAFTREGKRDRTRSHEEANFNVLIVVNL